MIDIKSLGGMTNLKLFHEGTVMIKEAAANPELMYIILNGTVNTVKGFDSENPVVEDTLAAGRIFGEQCLFTTVPSPVTYVNQTPISAIVISPEYFLELAQKKPQLVVTIMEEICLELAEAKNRKPARKAALTVDKSDSTITFLPKMHKGYPVVQPETFYGFLLKADKTCPYCKTVFNTDQIYSSKLRLKTPAGIDMRKTYTDFEPCWYDIITCPNCYFSCFDEYFERNELIYKSPEIIKTLEQIHSIYKLDFDTERSLDFVFICYYIALACAKAYDNHHQITAKIWLQLTYLYKDSGDAEMYTYSIKKAKESFDDFYGSVNMKPESEQYCCLVLAHLCLELGEEPEAIRYLNNVRMIKQGVAVYKTMAENKYYDIKEAKAFETSLKK